MFGESVYCILSIVYCISKENGKMLKFIKMLYNVFNIFLFEKKYNMMERYFLNKIEKRLNLNLSNLNMLEIVQK